MGNRIVTQWWIVWCCAVFGLATTSLCAENTETVPNWIWSPEQTAGHIPQVSCYFRKTVQLPAIERAFLAIAADDQFQLYVNGQAVGTGTAQQGIKTFDITSRLRPGENTLAVKVSNQQGGTAGLAARLVVAQGTAQAQTIVTDASWRTSLNSTLMWNRSSFSDRRWKPARPLGAFTNFVVAQQQTVPPAGAAQLAETPPSLTATPSASAGNPVPSWPTDRTNTVAAPAPPLPTGAEPLPNVPRTGAGTLPVPPAGELVGAAPKPTSPAAGDSQTGPYQPLARQPSSGSHVQVPREFQLEQVAGNGDVGSVTACTFNEFGQLIVAQEDGQLWLLADRDQDGRLDSRRDYGKLTTTCQGMLSLNGQLYLSGMAEEGLGLYRLRDTDQDGKLDAREKVCGFRGDNLEHGPHGIVLGPDGLLYVMVGNHTPLDTPVASPGPYGPAYEGDLLSPRFEDPSGHAAGVAAPGGYVIRIDPQGGRLQIVAGGLRNAYDLAFNAQGELFAHDSDMESDRGSTWFRPTRLYHVTEGAELGWRSGWAVWPEYYLDALPGIADTERGSPTGAVVYEHTAFPQVYRHALFSADWSEGRVWVISCREAGAKYQATPTVFMQGQPLNVTDLEIGPDGSLYVVTGGRGTAGNVYRVSWKGAGNVAKPPTATPLDVALQQPQPSSSWARQQFALSKQQLGDQWPLLMTAAAVDGRRTDAERVLALQIMQWVGPQPTPDLLAQLAGDRRVPVRRAAAYFLGLQNNPAASARLQQMLGDPDPFVRRRACESLARLQAKVPWDALTKLLASDDRHEAWAARRLLASNPLESWQHEVLATENQRLFLVGGVALLQRTPSQEMARLLLDRSLQFMEGFVNDANFIDLLRVQQLALHRSGMSIEEASTLRQRLTDEYPSSSATINRELIRLLCYLQADEIIDRSLAELAKDWPTEDKIHLAMHLTFLKSGWTTEQKLAVLQYLAVPSGAGAGIAGYLQNASVQFGEQMNDQEIQHAIEQGPANPASALAALLRLPEKLSASQIALLTQLDVQLAHVNDDTTRRVKFAIIAILARDGSPPATNYLRTVYDRDPTRRVEAALGMAETNDAANVPYLLQSLPLLEPEDARQTLAKLKELRQWPDGPEPYRQVILAAERLQGNGAEEAIALLESWQGFAPQEQPIPWQQAMVAWRAWFQQTYPQEVLPQAIPVTHTGKWDAAALLQHLERAAQDRTGSAQRGFEVFKKAQCIQCHRHGAHGEAMGPDLSSVSKRFLTREILESILQPSRVISDQYAAKVVTTTGGNVYAGLVANSGANELIILQADGRKIRVPQAEVDELEPSPSSAMPDGLLDGLTLDEITDLFAFLMADPTQLSKAPSTIQK